MDYRKMKIVKDRINQEIKDLKAEIASIEQSTILDKEEKEQAISVLEQQIGVKSSAILDIGKEFSQKLKDDERRKLVSPEMAAEMLKFFSSSPPEPPEENNL